MLLGTLPLKANRPTSSPSKPSTSWLTYLRKRSGLLINGRIETGSYEKDSARQHTTDILINKMQFLDRPQGVGGASTEANADELLDEEPAL